MPGVSLSTKKALIPPLAFLLGSVSAITMMTWARWAQLM